jgi:hypothetical protein
MVILVPITLISIQTVSQVHEQKHYCRWIYFIINTIPKNRYHILLQYGVCTIRFFHSITFHYESAVHNNRHLISYNNTVWDRERYKLINLSNGFRILEIKRWVFRFWIRIENGKIRAWVYDRMIYRTGSDRKEIY